MEVVKYNNKKILIEKLYEHQKEFCFAHMLYFISLKVKNSFIYILYRYTDIIGYAIVKKYKGTHENEMELDTMDIRKPYRRKGYGSFLLNHIKEDNDILSCQAVNESIPFYLKNGFIPIGDKPPICQSLMLYSRITPLNVALDSYNILKLCT